jgi:hypothetical protein
MKHDHHKLYRSLEAYLERIDQETTSARAQATALAAKHLYSQAEAETLKADQHAANYHTLSFLLRDANYPTGRTP